VSDSYDGRELNPDVEFALDRETGYPLLPAQRAVGLARMTDDATGEVVAEVLLLPNMLFYFQPHGGVLVGDSIICSPVFARQFAAGGLPERCEHVTQCDCHTHDGRSMQMEDVEKAQKKAIVDGFKAASGCAVCGERDPAVLDCHHRNPAEKHPRLRRLPIQTLSFRALGAELMKVEVLCANDHRRRTASAIH